MHYYHALKVVYMQYTTYKIQEALINPYNDNISYYYQSSSKINQRLFYHQKLCKTIIYILDSL